MLTPTPMMSLRTETYARTRALQVFRQTLEAVVARDAIEKQVMTFASRLRRDEERMAQALGRPVRGLDILEIGAGQQCERARYLGQYNLTTVIDLDWIPRTSGIGDYVAMLKRNGVGRLIKTAGRRLLRVDRMRRDAWARALGTSTFRDPFMMHGDVCSDPLPESAFDLIVSWSVFEHLRDPAAAMRNIWRALRPDGVFFIGIHLYTATNGHHDFSRSQTGDDGLPPWAHLRPSTRHLVRPSAFLNEWRVADWRRLYADYAEVKEYLDDYGDAVRMRGLLTDSLRAELDAFDEPELVTIDAYYVGKKPPTVNVTTLPEPSMSVPEAANSVTALREPSVSELPEAV